MNLLIRSLPRDLPVFIRQAILTELFATTARAFDRPVPVRGSQPYAARLQAYAWFTREQAERALQLGRDVPALKTRLYQHAYPLGRMLRRGLGVNSTEGVMALGQILYRAIGVDILGDAQGNVTVTRCYFSQFYSAPVCDLISALDDGLFSGLSDGDQLVFGARLTEGQACCRAKLQRRSN